MLVANNLTLQAGSHLLHAGINIRWHYGEFVAVLGPNGIGKSTLLSTLGGIAPFPQGQISLDDQNISQIHPLQRAYRISSIAQYDEANPDTTVYNRISHGLYARSALTRTSQREESTLVHDIAAKLDIETLLSRPLFALSGGQRKKVHIARVLVNPDATVFILDEPDASLDAQSRLQVMGLLKRISAQNKLVIASLHHTELANEFATTCFEF